MLGVAELLGRVGESLIPPHDADPNHLFRWRLILAGVTFMNFSVMTLHILLACGYLSMFGFTGFAQASDLQQQTDLSVDMRADQIDQQITHFREKQCDAQNVRNWELARSYGERIRDKQREYQRLALQYPKRVPIAQASVPPCQSL